MVRALFQKHDVVPDGHLRWGPVHREFSASSSRTLNELRTIQYLEESVGPAGLRRLADAMLDDGDRRIVQDLRRRAASAGLELETIIEDWTAVLTKKPRTPPRIAPGGLDAGEILESFVEVKRASAELLRRAAADAPSPQLRDRLLSLAEEEDHAARELTGLGPARRD